MRKKGDYYPCPPREKAAFDEVVVFNPAVVLPAASFEFKRRRRTLLSLDDGPDRNAPILKQFPGCPEHKSMLAVASYPMRQHCNACKHGLMLDTYPFGTVRERQKAVKAAAAAVGAAAKVAQETPRDEAEQKEQECQRAFDLANALVAEVVPAAARISDVQLQHLRGIHHQGVHCAFHRDGYATRGTLLLSSHHVREGACNGTRCVVWPKNILGFTAAPGVPRGTEHGSKGDSGSSTANAWGMVSDVFCSVVFL